MTYQLRGILHRIVISSYLGQEVEVYLSDDLDNAEAITRGTLLSFSDDGGIVTRDEMGFNHYSWPALDVRLVPAGKASS